MDNVERFNALMSYIETHPEVMARYGKPGVAVLRRIAGDCEARDQTALGESVDAFLELVAGGQATRGITPSRPTPTVEQFNRIEKATKAVLEKFAHE